MFIYKVTNLITHKIYIGQTTRSLKQRFTEHCRVNSGCPRLSRSIKKHGKENFTIEEIDGANSQSELDYLEDFYIYEFNSLSPDGLNLRRGGSGGKPSTETVEKMRESSTGRKHLEESKEKMRNRKVSKYTKNKISEAGKSLFLFKEFRIKRAIAGGAKLFEVFKITEHTGYKRNFNILNTEYVGEWVSQAECARDLRVDNKNINACLNGRSKYHKFYIFKYKN